MEDDQADAMQLYKRGYQLVEEDQADTRIDAMLQPMQFYTHRLPAMLCLCNIAARTQDIKHCTALSELSKQHCFFTLREAHTQHCTLRLMLRSRTCAQKEQSKAKLPAPEMEHSSANITLVRTAPYEAGLSK